MSVQSSSHRQPEVDSSDEEVTPVASAPRLEGPSNDVPASTSDLSAEEEINRICSAPPREYYEILGVKPVASAFSSL